MDRCSQITREDFAEFLVNVRESLGMTRKAFGEMVGFPDKSLKTWEEIQRKEPRDMYEKFLHIRECVKNEHRRRRKAK